MHEAIPSKLFCKPCLERRRCHRARPHRPLAYQHPACIHGKPVKRPVRYSPPSPVHRLLCKQSKLVRDGFAFLRLPVLLFPLCTLDLSPPPIPPVPSLFTQRLAVPQIVSPPSAESRNRAIEPQLPCREVAHGQSGVSSQSRLLRVSS